MVKKICLTGLLVFPGHLAHGLEMDLQAPAAEWSKACEIAKDVWDVKAPEATVSWFREGAQILPPSVLSPVFAKIQWGSTLTVDEIFCDSEAVTVAMSADLRVLNPLTRKLSRKTLQWHDIIYVVGNELKIDAVFYDAAGEEVHRLTSGVSRYASDDVSTVSTFLAAIPVSQPSRVENGEINAYLKIGPLPEKLELSTDPLLVK